MDKGNALIPKNALERLRAAGTSENARKILEELLADPELIQAVVCLLIQRMGFAGAAEPDWSYELFAELTGTPKR